jgi:DMSO reductase anchor subunit
MNPALSVLFFTTLSGAGLGLLVVLAVMQASAPLPLSREFAVAPLALGMLLLALGLGSSFLHLGQPQRAWRAFSQWRSSWLSREAWAAASTLAVAGGVALLVWHGRLGTGFVAANGLLVVLSLCTLVATSGIYTSLKPVPAWHNRFVLPVLLLAALTSGAAWLWTLLTLAMWELPRAGAWLLASACLALAGLKLAYWRHVDRLAAGARTAAHPSGLGTAASVRSLEAPHTETNYLLREMGYVLARKHARRLRAISAVLVGPLPAGLVGWASTGTGDTGLALATVASLMLGLFVERWLFFAEARHHVAGYYR